MKKIWEKIKNYQYIGKKQPQKELERKELEKKVIEGANKALKEYGRVFERLAEHDRT